MSRQAIPCIVLAAAASFAAVPQISAQTTTGLQFRDVQAGSAKHRYEVFVPPGWTAAKKWPVILFLHGAGHRGSYTGPNDFVLGNLFLRYQQPTAFVIVFPRCPTGRWWNESEMENVALAALEQAAKEFRGDAQRIYVTGMSMGGYGTWYLASRHPDKFAAIAPVCGGVKGLSAFSLPAVGTGADPYADVAKRIGKTPVWMFHGSADDAVPVAESRQMAAALKAAGGNVRYTEYKGVGHNSWDRAYAEPEFFRWLLSNRLPARAPATASPR